jgi:hypothetical protein
VPDHSVAIRKENEMKNNFWDNDDEIKECLYCGKSTGLLYGSESKNKYGFPSRYYHTDCKAAAEAKETTDQATLDKRNATLNNIAETDN